MRFARNILNAPELNAAVIRVSVITNQEGWPELLWSKGSEVWPFDGLRDPTFQDLPRPVWALLYYCASLVP